MLTAIAFIAILALLIVVHELGHFWAAKRSGVKVEEFCIGFPPRIWKKQKGETLFSIGIVPLGGFVKIFGEDDTEQNDPRAFAFQPAWRRAIMLVAGVLMNLALAYILIVIILGFGTPTAFDGAVPQGARDPSIRIIEVQLSSPAHEAGMQVGDTIKKITAQDAIFDPAPFIGSEDVLDSAQNFIREHKGQNLEFILERGKTNQYTVSVTPRVNPPEGQGALGIAMLKMATVRTTWYLLPWEGLKTTWELLKMFAGGVYDILKQMFAHGRLSENISGPIGIVKITSQTLPLGFVYVLQLVAILSLNLAVINILPFPALDGGRLLFLAIEKIRGKPLKRDVERWANAVGFLLLLLFMVVVAVKDIGRFF